jgi:uncharacterized membrane protein
LDDPRHDRVSQRAKAAENRTQSKRFVCFIAVRHSRSVWAAVASAPLFHRGFNMVSSSAKPAGEPIS